MESAARGEERTWSNVRMFLLLLLRDVQRHRAIGFTVDKLLHFRIRTRTDFIRRTLRDNATASKHNHPCRDTKSARHIVRHHHCGHVTAMSQFEGELIDHCGHDRIESRRGLVAEKQLRIERERTRQANALFHSAAYFSWFEIFKTSQPDHLKFLFHNLFDFIS